MNHPHLLSLEPTRVRRNYTGGLLLDRLLGASAPADSNQPEDWLASITPARNPGMPLVINEGLSATADGTLLRDLFADAGDHYLGAQRNTGMTFLAKLLDSAVRLQVQAHPTATFAQQHMNSPFGKFESYVILGARPGIEPYIRLGFQNAPTPAEWKRIVLEQDIAAMDACFEKVPVQPGEVWIVPGGLPHAIGEGLFVIEVMEPSDLVVRCEFGEPDSEQFVPPEARFMGCEPDFALRIFDHTSYSVDEITNRCRLTPRSLDEGNAWQTQRLIGAEQTPGFIVDRLHIAGDCTTHHPDRLQLAIVVEGNGVARAGADTVAILPGARFVIPAATCEVTWQIENSATIILCESQVVA